MTQCAHCGGNCEGTREATHAALLYIACGLVCKSSILQMPEEISIVPPMMIVKRSSCDHLRTSSFADLHRCYFPEDLAAVAPVWTLTILSSHRHRLHSTTKADHLSCSSGEAGEGPCQEALVVCACGVGRSLRSVVLYRNLCRRPA
jgi:hypothetical protein